MRGVVQVRRSAGEATRRTPRCDPRSYYPSSRRASIHPRDITPGPDSTRLRRAKRIYKRNLTRATLENSVQNYIARFNKNNLLSVPIAHWTFDSMNIELTQLLGRTRGPLASSSTVATFSPASPTCWGTASAY